jgi:hypothetical protein
MIEADPQTRSRLALDTDWLTAVMTALALLILLVALAGSVWGMVQQWPVRLLVSWRTAVLALVCIWLFMKIRPRLLRLGFALIGIVSGSEALLYIAHASLPAQMENAQIMRVVETVACLSFLVHIVRWFRAKIRYV